MQIFLQYTLGCLCSLTHFFHLTEGGRYAAARKAPGNDRKICRTEVNYLLVIVKMPFLPSLTCFLLCLYPLCPSLLFHSWYEEKSKTGQASPQAKGVNLTEKKTPQRLNAAPALLAECWRIDKQCTNAERSNPIQTTIVNDCILFHLDHTVCRKHDV